MRPREEVRLEVVEVEEERLEMPMVGLSGSYV